MDDRAPTTQGTGSSSSVHRLGLADYDRQLPEGSVINGRYEVEGCIGRGGMGVVYRVRDRLHPSVPLALKTIRSRLVQRSQVSLFKSEFKIMATLRHPGVAAVHDFDVVQEGRDYFFTMDLVAGDDLYQATEGLELQPILDLFVQICRAIAYVHDRGFIHLDLKPSNILVDAGGQPRIVDFGVAATRNVLDGSLKGTLHFMAPEMAVDRRVDHRADLYSLGIVLYQLLCRQVPFAGTNAVSLLQSHREAPLPFETERARRVPEALRSVIAKLCAKDPADRYRNANTVIAAISEGSGVAYEVQTPATRESYVFSSRFIGRERELDEVYRFVEQRLRGDSGSCAFLALGGPSGAGKSRLMREVRCQAQLSERAVVEATCYEGKGTELGPLLDIVAAVRSLVVAAGGGEQLAQLLPANDELGASRPDNAAAAASPHRSQAADAAVELLLGASKLVPFVMHVDNVQWASPATVAALEAVAARAGEARARLALVVSYRDDEVQGRPAAELLRRPHRACHLASLQTEAVGQLLASMIGLEVIPDAFTRRVAGETAGNPFFVEEVMRQLIENGSVFLEDGRWATSDDIGRLALPASIANALGRRLAMLAQREREILETLAVVERPTSLSFLEQLEGQLSDATLEALARLERHAMVSREARGELTYRISHDRLREIACATLSVERRRALHHLVAATLERAHKAGDMSRIGEMAHHFGCADEPNKAVEYGIAAAMEHGAAFGLSDVAAVI